MPVTSDGQQLVGLVAARVLFKRDSIGATDFPMLDFGTLKAAPTPGITNERLQIKDPFYCGVVVHEESTDTVEAYTVQTQNISPLNLALYFAADPPSALTQSATLSSDVLHSNVVVGGFVQVATAGGLPVFDLTSIADVTLDPGGDDTALALWNGTTGDYVVVDLARGLIRLLPGGAASMTEGSTVDIAISYTPKAISGNRIINPQTRTKIEGVAQIYYKSNCGDQEAVRICRASITSSAANFQQSGTDSSDLSFNLTVIGDPTSPTPAGKFYYFKGTVPTNMPGLPSA